MPRTPQFSLFHIYGVVIVICLITLLFDTLYWNLTNQLQAHSTSIVPEETAISKTDTASSSTFHLNVMLVGYNPSEGARTLADTYFIQAMGGLSAKEYEQAVFDDMVRNFQALSEGTINYSLAYYLSIERFQPYLDGSEYTIDSFKYCVYGTPYFDSAQCDRRKFSFDYIQWARENNICALAAAHNIDEIWMISPAYLTAYESFMIGPTDGFAVNGEAFVVPGCNRHYIVLNGTYDRPDTVMHSYSHKVEAILNKVTNNWSSSDRQYYFENYIRLDAYDWLSNTPFCGNGHYPSNTSLEYNYSNKQNASSLCEDWKSFPNITGRKTIVNCDTWGCTDTGWQKYWLGSLPRNYGFTKLHSNTGEEITVYNNWWHYILYPEAVLTQKY